MVSLNTAYKVPLRRIYLIWGIVLLIGFILSGYGILGGYGHWYILSLIGVASQIVGMRLSSWQSKVLLIMWALVSFIGTFRTQQIFAGWIDYPGYLGHIGMFWLAIISMPQVITGYLLKKKLQMALGGIWLIIAILLWNTTMDPLLSFYFLAFVTGLPYLYIAFKK